MTDISLMFILLAVMVLLFTSFFIAIRNMQYKQQALEQLQKQKEETERQKLMVEQTLSDLEATQTQLIQREKMASLGELTAGIAHEIQNPLNFVKNFSEVCTELADELAQELSVVQPGAPHPLAMAIRENLKMITLHSNRADAIIKSMMQHSRISNGKKEQTDLHLLIQDYLRLSYQGMKARHKQLNVSLREDFDVNVRPLMLIPEDIGRVLLNLFNNAFYALQEKQRQQGPSFQPELLVSTRNLGQSVEIVILDNGTGIPSEIQNKILQPFFTTKPTGQGTGLGLSLSYDIIKAHRGNLQVISEDGKFAEFRILLPLKA